MPPLPRFDPLWLVIPAVAILIALGRPTTMPIKPHADGPRLVLAARDPQRSTTALSEPLSEPGRSAPSGATDSAGGLGPGDGFGTAPRHDVIEQALGVSQVRAVVRTPVPPPLRLTPGTSAEPSTTPAPSTARSTPAAHPAPSPRAPSPKATSSSRRPATPTVRPPSAPRSPRPADRRAGERTRPAVTPPAAGPPGGGEGDEHPDPPPGDVRPENSAAPPAHGGRVRALRWPLSGAVTVSRGFERPLSPYGPGHRGIDLKASPAAPVLAAADGVVSFAGSVANRGIVTVTHGDLRTTYEPLTPAISPGTAVRAGDLLGWMSDGHPGCPVAACLHWGLLRRTDYLNPLLFFRRTPPRLLPLLPLADRSPGSPAFSQARG